MAEFGEMDRRLNATSKEKSFRRSMPRIEKLGHVHPRVHFCRNAELVRLKGGMGRIVSRNVREDVTESFELYLDDKQLMSGYAPTCPTCSGHLWAGYGDGLMDIEECLAVRDRINAEYPGLKGALDHIAPLLGLMESGLYVVAETELFPFMREAKRNGKVEGQYFWDAPAYRQECQLSHTWGSYDEAHIPPLYLFPTQRAAGMNAARVEEYMQLLQKQAEGFPRAIALYLSGSVALLLDGHHKAAACAALGKRVPTLMIFPVQKTKELEEALQEGRRLYMAQRGALWVRPIILKDGQDRWLSEAISVGYMERKTFHVPQREEIPWGRVDDQYRTEHFEEYPHKETLFHATEIPPDTFQREISELMTTPEEEDRYYKARSIRDLCAYDRLFPDSKVFTPKQKEFLRKQ